MSEVRRICLVGASGLTGSEIMQQAVGRTDLRLVGVSRREMQLPRGARMEMLLADPSGWADAIAASGASALICALGTTLKKAGSVEAFHAIDHDLVLSVAKAARQAGIGHFVLVSSVAADPSSSRLYLRTKGETERDVARLGFRRLDVLRPGLIRGDRAERRPLERLAMLLSPLVDPFLLGDRRKFRSIRVQDLAAAALALTGQRAGGHFVHEHDALLYAVRRDDLQVRPASKDGSGNAQLRQRRG